MEMIKNTKGGKKLCYKGYSYTKKSCNSTSIRWECSRRKALNCNGKITTNLDANEVLSSIGHKHENSDAFIEATKMKIVIKERATFSRGSTKQILVDSIEEISENARLEIGNLNALKRNIQRERQIGRPKNPDTLEELQIPTEWTTTGEEDGRPFLIYDNGHEAEKRIIIFLTQESMHHLANTKTWFMDGTYSTAPALFEQLFVIRAPLGNSAISCVYAFLSGKTQEIYEEFFTELCKKADQMGLDFNPDITMTDFEKATINAINHTFGPAVQTKTCFFHLKQSTWRKLQNLGLSKKYKEDENTRIFCAMVNGLAFLPIDKVVDGMKWLKDICHDDLKPFLDYFDATYVTGTKRRRGYIPPLFPPEKWNVYEATITDKDRTNNLCESWNNGFKNLVGYSHPTIWAAIENLRKDAIMVKNHIRNEARGEPLKKRVRRETVIQQERLKYLCIEFSDGRKPIEETLYGIGSNTKMFFN